MTTVRRAGLAAALAAAPFAFAWRFALVYRVRAGFPRARPPSVTPELVGLPWEPVTVEAPGARLAGWFIPARDRTPGPGVALLHGWESARDRTLPLAQVLHACGFHVLTADVRGHGDNSPEHLPVSAGEFGADALATFHALLERPEVTVGAIAGHSMGGIGAILAAAADPRVAALVSTSAPADPYRLTRQTFRLARLPIPDPIAYPLAWITTRVFLAPRGHRAGEVSASQAIARYRGPVLLLHGDEDQVVPVSHLARLERAVRAARGAGDRPAGAGAPGVAAAAGVAAEQDGSDSPGAVVTLVVRGGRHSWLYEDPGYRAAVGRFLARWLGGPLEPDEAARVAAAVPATRIPDESAPISAIAAEPGGVRSLAGIVARAQVRGRGLPDAAVPVPDEAFNPLTGPTTVPAATEPAG